MKIIVVASLAYSLVNFRGRLLSSMIDHGYEVVACAPDRDPEIEARLKAMGVTYRAIPMARTGLNPVGDLLTLFGLVKCFWREQPDIVLAYTQKPIIYSGIACRMFARIRFYAMVSGLGHVYSENGSSILSYVRALVSALYRVALKTAKAVFVFNGDDRGEMIRHAILHEGTRVIQVPGSGVDLSHYAHRPIPHGPPIFLMVARLLQNKGLVEYVEAAKRVRIIRPDLQFHLLGPLDENPSAVSRETIEQWHSAGAINYLGETRDVRPYLAAASFFVLPSWYREGLPRTILEAMAVGRGVITTDMPGCREPIVEGVNGYIVEPRNIQALVDAMLRVIADPTTAARLGEAARKTVESRFSVEQVNAQLLGAMGMDRQGVNVSHPPVTTATAFAGDL